MPTDRKVRARLIVRVRFLSPAPSKRPVQAGILRAPDGCQGAVRFFSTWSPRVLQPIDICLTSACVLAGHSMPLGQRSPRAGADRVTRGVSMPTFVLVRRGFCRGWVRAETVAALQEDGHRVIDLPNGGTVAADLSDLRSADGGDGALAGETFLRVCGIQATRPRAQRRSAVASPQSRLARVPWTPLPGSAGHDPNLCQRLSGAGEALGIALQTTRFACRYGGRS
jgi:hypothetical protein